LRRLERGKRALDQKIAVMATSGSVRSPAKTKTHDQVATTASALESATLRDVLYNSAGLSSFMEYMDRHNVMRVVQFWIVVDGIRNPLDAEMDDSGDYTMTWTDSDRADIAQINEAYLALPEINASNQAQEAVGRFLRAGRSATPQEYIAARRAVLQTQKSVYEDMVQHHYPNFKKSDLYYKWLASDEAAAAATVVSPTAASPASSANGLEPAPARKVRPPKLPRLSTSAIKKEPDLRRAVVSSSDLKAFVRSSGSASPPRRSLDDSAQRAPLFDDDEGDDALARSVQSLDSDQEPRRSLENDQGVVDAMQAALTDIMDSQPDKNSLFSDSSVRPSVDNDSLAGSTEIERTASPALGLKGDRAKPSLASLGLVGAKSTSRFLDDNIFGDEERFLEDEREDSDVNDKSDEDAIHEAAPGDLGLAEAIDTLTGEIAKLVTQESIVDSLTNKAELTNNAAELRILRKSKASLQREINRKELQRQQYIVQESDNSLYGRATVSIQSIMVGQEEDGKEFAMCMSYFYWPAAGIIN
jgi:sorting nexin-25